jgi:hypothetical protein
VQDIRVRLSTLWVFMLFNYLYCDVVTGFDHTLTMSLSPDALLAASFLMEIPIVMIVLSRVLTFRPNRWLNVLAGAFMTLAQVGSFFVGAPAHYYVFFSAIEIACLLFIVWTAWRWANPVPAATSA